MGSAEGTLVNGEPMRDALLRPGDQVVFDAHHRFVVEAPMRGRTPGEHVRDDGERVVEVVDDGDVEPGRPASPWRLPWLLLAALVIAKSEEHTSELQSLMRISYAVFCLK